MDKGIFVALSGAVLQERRMEVLSDNLANVNTAGFKSQRPLFELASPDRFGIRTFGKLDEVANDLSQGMVQKTERKLDAAIRGEGFFAIETPYGRRYTRDGSFTVSTDGRLVTKEGNAVVGDKGEIRISSPEVSIDAVGNITSGGAPAGRLAVVTFKDLSLLKREGSFYAALPGAQEAPASPSTQVEQGYIESSNVNAVKAMTTMIEALRSYETHSKMIQSIDDMTRKAVEEVGRT